MSFSIGSFCSDFSTFFIGEVLFWLKLLLFLADGAFCLLDSGVKSSESESNSEELLFFLSESESEPELLLESEFELELLSESESDEDFLDFLSEDELFAESSSKSPLTVSFYCLADEIYGFFNKIFNFSY